MFAQGASAQNWRPGITKHAAGRYLERVRSIPVPNPSIPVEKQLDAMLGGLPWDALIEEIWPSRIPLKANPGCAFTLKRGGFSYCVTGGALVTVIKGTGRRLRHAAKESDDDE